MYGKEDERQVVTTRDIQKTLRTQLNYNLPVLIIGVIFSLITIPFIFTLLAETIKSMHSFYSGALIFLSAYFIITSVEFLFFKGVYV